MFHIFSKNRRVAALPQIGYGYKFGAHESKGLNLLEVGAFVGFSLLVMAIGR